MRLDRKNASTTLTAVYLHQHQEQKEGRGGEKHTETQNVFEALGSKTVA